MKRIISGLMLTLLLVATLYAVFNVRIARASRNIELWSSPWGDWGHYHNYTEIVDTLLYLNDTYPNIVDVFSIGESWQNSDIYCIRLTNEAHVYPKPKVFFVGYHHAREPIGAELSLYFAVDAASHYGTNATITHMLNHSEIYIIIALNVDGFELFEANDWQRKNARPTDEDYDGLVDEDPPEEENQDGFIERLFNVTDPSRPQFIRWEGIDNDSDGEYAEDWIGGVDLNRNYDYRWQYGSTNPQSEIYKGPAPFSEPETQAIRNLVSEHNFTYAISFHSGVELILYPWGYTQLPSPDEAKFIEIAKNLSNITGGTPYEQSSDFYISYGLWDDWMYGTEGVFALTCEIFFNQTWEGVTKPGPYPNTVWQGGLKYEFNPFPSSIESIVLRWLPVFFHITNRAIAENHDAYDVATIDIATAKNVVEQGSTMQINVTVMNEGDFLETFNITVYANTTSIASQTVTLTSGSFTSVMFAWGTAGFALGNYTLSAYASSVLGETDLDDNWFIDGEVVIGKSGDLNFDGIISYKDASLFRLAYIGEYNALADFNQDEVINYKDAAMFRSYYMSG